MQVHCLRQAQAKSSPKPAPCMASSPEGLWLPPARCARMRVVAMTPLKRDQIAAPPRISDAGSSTVPIVLGLHHQTSAPNLYRLGVLISGFRDTTRGLRLRAMPRARLIASLLRVVDGGDAVVALSAHAPLTPAVDGRCRPTDDCLRRPQAAARPAAVPRRGASQLGSGRSSTHEGAPNTACTGRGPRTAPRRQSFSLEGHSCVAGSVARPDTVRYRDCHLRGDRRCCFSCLACC
jgi:hypothetical protein